MSNKTAAIKAWKYIVETTMGIDSVIIAVLVSIIIVFVLEP